MFLSTLLRAGGQVTRTSAPKPSDRRRAEKRELLNAKSRKFKAPKKKKKRKKKLGKRMEKGKVYPSRGPGSENSKIQK